MEHGTDGTFLQDGTRYFTCGPRRGYFCLLEHLVPNKQFMPDKKFYDCKFCISLNKYLHFRYNKPH